MIIRPFHKHDMPAVLNIYANAKLDELQFEKNTFSLLPLDQDEMRMDIFNTSDIYVCEDDGVIAYGGVRGGEITLLFVDSAARGKGVGTKLLETLISVSLGVVHLNVVSSNIIAIDLYEKYGFTIVNEFDADYNGVKVTASLMVKT